MEKVGFGRPGAMQMVAALALMIAGSLGPLFVAATRPSHEWAMVATGFPAFLMGMVGLAVIVLYAVGFIRYCASKGYSKWLGFFLLLGNFFGFLVLLLLPDIKAAARLMQETSNRSTGVPTTSSQT